MSDVPGGYECASRMGFYAVSPSSGPFWIGCLVYAIIGTVAAIICCFAFGAKNRGIAVHSAIIGTVCLWIMYVLFMIYISSANMRIIYII